MRLKCCVKLWKIDHWSQGKESLLLEELICHYCNTSTEARVGREMCSLRQRAKYLPFGSLCWILVCHLSISNFSREVWNQDNRASFWVKAWCGEKKHCLECFIVTCTGWVLEFHFVPVSIEVRWNSRHWKAAQRWEWIDHGGEKGLISMLAWETWIVGQQP